ncbi:MAG: sugar phosphate isomerase/epimerase [Clostridia bacterium]|nr:sugar phosphate isomerase/epimerase [Clostridia bacterium]
MEKLKLSAFADEASAALSEQIKALNDNDIPYIEVRGVDGKNVSSLTLAEAKETYQKLKAGGISVYSIGSPIGKVRLGDDFENELARFEHTLEIARVMEASCIRLFSFFDASLLGEGAREAVITRLTAFADRAKDSGIVLCHENEKGIYGDTAERCLDIVSTVSGIKSVFDPANFVQCGVDTAKAWELLKDTVQYLHVKDALADGTVVPAGYGIGNLEAITADYIARGGKVATLEPHLHAFTGLSALSGEDADRIIGSRRFQNGREAFDYAVKCYRELLARI